MPMCLVITHVCFSKLLFSKLVKYSRLGLLLFLLFFFLLSFFKGAISMKCSTRNRTKQNHHSENRNFPEIPKLDMNMIKKPGRNSRAIRANPRKSKEAWTTPTGTNYVYDHFFSTSTTFFFYSPACTGLVGRSKFLLLFLLFQIRLDNFDILLFDFLNLHNINSSSLRIFYICIRAKDNWIFMIFLRIFIRLADLPWIEFRKVDLFLPPRGRKWS